jgi:Flp pilus assembly pilin Flp
MELSRERPVQPHVPEVRLRRDDGVESLEVALIGALIMIAILVAYPVLSAGVAAALSSLSTAIENAGVGIE